MATAIGTLFRILRMPVLDETRRNLARSRSRVAPRFRVPQQMLGTQANSCGATIGAMPRCDFACTGCYLGEDANRVPPASVDEIKRQMRELAPLLGNPGNIQLTDGEITLRDDAEVIDLLRYAASLGLIPMLMTHGDSFRRRPGLLERYMTEGGLSDVSIHIDTTQRGRLGREWRNATTEADLHPLRDEFARLIAAARSTTGLPLRCATTMTVTRDNLGGVADVVRWVVEHADTFRMISFQPIAQVGRTADGLGGGVDVEALWHEIERGLPMSANASELDRGKQWLGHPDCNRFVNGLLVQRPGGSRVYLPLRVEGDPVGPAEIDAFLARFGGVSFRRDSPVEALTRVAALTMRAPWFLSTRATRYVASLLRRMAPEGTRHVVGEWWRGELQVTPLVIVSHHFMSPAQLDSPVGRERLEHCVFHVNIDGETLSMCEANAQGRRQAFYDRLSDSRRATRAPAATERSREAPAPGLAHSSAPAPPA